MEKIVVKSWDDLKEHCCRVEKNEDGNIYVFYPLQIEIRIDERTTHLKYAVDLLNKIFTDQNFEHKEVEVIDTLEKFIEFLKKISVQNDNLYFYLYDFKVCKFVRFRKYYEQWDRCVDINKIEEEYNVDLKILK